ncbi:MAG: BrnT family toxin [Syntrophobacterales bacterium]|nr:BrnT family toxin [Syntrophobacterales bacterium]
MIGNSNKDRLMVVVYTERVDNIRLISARKASKKERNQYEENAKKSGHA